MKDMSCFLVFSSNCALGGCAMVFSEAAQGSLGGRKGAFIRGEGWGALQGALHKLVEARHDMAALRLASSGWMKHCNHSL